MKRKKERDLKAQLWSSKCHPSEQPVPEAKVSSRPSQGTEPRDAPLTPEWPVLRMAADGGGKELQCKLCPQTIAAEAAESLEGPLLPAAPGSNSNTAFAHRECLLWCPEAYESLNGQIQFAVTAFRRARSLYCAVCGTRGAGTGCVRPECSVSLHLACARVSGAVLDPPNFRLWCAQHKPAGVPNEHGATRRLPAGDARATAVLQARRGHTALLSSQPARDAALAGGNKAAHATTAMPIDPSRLPANETLGGISQQLQQVWEAAALPLIAPDWAPARGALLTGAPGSGKTAAARWLAKCLAGSAHVIVRRAADCLGRFHGDAERALASLFHEAARLAPCVVFFDEIDALASSRSNSNQQTTQRGAVATLLSLMDGLPEKVAVLAATCRPMDVDVALRRPGRLDREIHFALASSQSRFECLKQLTQDWRHAHEGVLHRIAEYSTGMSGAHLKSLCTRAVINSCRRARTAQHVVPDEEDLMDAFHAELNQMHTTSQGGAVRPEPLPATLAPWLNTHLEKLRNSKAQCMLICDSGVGNFAVAALERATLTMASTTVDVALDQLFLQPVETLGAAAQDMQETAKASVSCLNACTMLRLPTLDAWAFSSSSASGTSTLFAILISMLDSLLPSRNCAMVARCNRGWMDLPDGIQNAFTRLGMSVDVKDASLDEVKHMAGAAAQEIAAGVQFVPTCDENASWCSGLLNDIGQSAQADGGHNADGFGLNKSECELMQRKRKDAREIRVRIREDIKAAAAEVVTDGHFRVALDAFDAQFQQPATTRRMQPRKRKNKKVERWPLSAVVEAATKGDYTSVMQLHSDVQDCCERASWIQLLEGSCKCATVDMLLSKTQHLRAIEWKAAKLEHDLPNHSGASEIGAQSGAAETVRYTDKQSSQEENGSSSVLLGKRCRLKDEENVGIVVKASRGGSYCVRLPHRHEERWVDVHETVSEWMLLTGAPNAGEKERQKKHRRLNDACTASEQATDAKVRRKTNEHLIRSAVAEHLYADVRCVLQEANEVLPPRVNGAKVALIHDAFAWVAHELNNQAHALIQDTREILDADEIAKQLCQRDGVSLMKHALMSSLVT